MFVTIYTPSIGRQTIITNFLDHNLNDVPCFLFNYTNPLYINSSCQRYNNLLCKNCLLWKPQTLLH